MMVSDLLCGRPRRKILADPFSRHTKLLLLIGLFLLHDGQDDILAELALLGKAPHFDSLGMRRGAVLQLHHFVERTLLLFGQIGQFHSGPHGDLSLVHHVQQRRDQIGEADIALDLGFSIWA